MSQKKKWGRPKGLNLSEETKKKISESVKAAYRKMKQEELPEDDGSIKEEHK